MELHPFHRNWIECISFIVCTIFHLYLRQARRDKHNFISRHTSHIGMTSQFTVVNKRVCSAKQETRNRCVVIWCDLPMMDGTLLGVADGGKIRCNDTLWSCTSIDVTAFNSRFEWRMSLLLVWLTWLLLSLRESSLSLWSPAFAHGNSLINFLFTSWPERNLFEFRGFFFGFVFGLLGRHASFVFSFSFFSLWNHLMDLDDVKRISESWTGK